MPEEEEDTLVPNPVELFEDGEKYHVCPICEGEGKYVDPQVDSQGLTAEDFDEMGEDFREDYFRGVYDVTCKACNGRRVITKRELDAYEDRHEMFVTQMAEMGERYGDSRL